MILTKEKRKQIVHFFKETEGMDVVEIISTDNKIHIEHVEKLGGGMIAVSDFDMDANVLEEALEKFYN